jgi:hypothetical protein
MQFGSRTASTVTLLALIATGCDKRGLQSAEMPPVGIDGGILLDGRPSIDADPIFPTDAGSDDGRAPGLDGGLPAIDAGESGCVTAAISLPWTKPASMLTRLDVVTTADAVAVMNRRTDLLDVRTYTRDGAVVAGFQFAADAQFLPYRDGRFLLVTRGVTGSFSATALDPDLVGGTRLYGAPASATEHVRAAIPLATSTVLITDERFVNVGGVGSAAWSAILGAADADTFRSSNIYGLAAESDRVLIAWGVNDVLRLAVVDTSGALLTRADHPSFFAGAGGYAPSAIPWGNGLLLFDGTDVRLTQIGFDLSLVTLGDNKQLRTFYRTAPRVAAVALPARPLAFWLTVFPETDNSQGYTTHQLYGCEIDLAAPSTCLATAPIAATGLTGYGIAEEPLAVAAFPDAATFAIAHTDAGGRSWLRLANLGCATRLVGP